MILNKRDYAKLFTYGMRVLHQRGCTVLQAEDICQRAITRSCQKFDPAKGKYRTYFILWVLGLGKNYFRKKVKRAVQKETYKQYRKDYPKKEDRISWEEIVELKEECKYLMRNLSARERYILKKHSEGTTYKELAKHFKLSRERIRQIADRAIRKIRNERKIENLRYPQL